MRAVSAWPASDGDGKTRDEAVLKFDQGRDKRLLVIPPLFDEANKFRRQLVEVMYRLDLSGIDSFLPDLPGTNESLFPQDRVTLFSLRKSVADACKHFGITHWFSVRTGALYAPETLPGWRYAPIPGRNALRSLMRARTLASREAGTPETMDQLEELGETEGLTAGGWTVGPALFEQLSTEPLADAGLAIDIDHETIGGKPLWLRAEPDEDPEQADALAAILAIGMVGE